MELLHLWLQRIMELQEVEKKEVHEESKDECVLMPSILQGSSDKHQPYSDDKLNSNELEVDVDLDGPCGYCHAKEDEIPTNISENENYHKQVSGQELTFPSVNVQDVEKKVLFPQSQDECVSVPSTPQEDSACNQPYSDGKVAFDEENVESAVDGACGCSQAKEDEIPTGLTGDTWEDCHQEPVSFPGSEVPTSQAQLQKSTHVTECLQWQLDQHLDCGDSKAILGLSSPNWAFTTNPDSGNQGPLFLENENYHKQVSGQELTFPSVNMQDVEKKVLFPQSQDECVSVPSTPQESSACNQPYSDGKVAFDEENVESAVDGACGCSQAKEDEIPTGLTEKQNDHDDLKGPEVVAPRFSRQMPQMAEYGVPQNSLDDYYLTYSGLPSLSDTFWSYTSTAIFSPEDLDVSYARDVTGEYFLVIECHLDAQVDSVCFVLLASGVLRFLIPVGSSVDSDLNQTLWQSFTYRHQVGLGAVLSSSFR
ncbi:NBPF family member NBPF15-like isoform X2 [Odocoileus virginianus]|uniref:NBPF family member NBPF15-like isoform X2 n=1 Tax=Odocoileus virginianus TaxID=9874 RepID=A0ABM4I652_ODOVR